MKASTGSKTPTGPEHQASHVIEILHREVLDAYRSEYAWMNNSFRDLDHKAQATITVAGIFLAAAFAFISQSTFDQRMGTRVALGLLVLALVGTVLLSVLSIKVREVSAEPPAGEVRRLVNDLIREETSQLPKRLAFFYSDQAQLWLSCVDSYRNSIKSKASVLQKAQWLLLVSACLAAILSLNRVWIVH